MNPKQLFHLNQDAVKRVRAVVTSTEFEAFLVYVRAQLMNRPGVTAEQIKGAIAYEEMLKDMPMEEISSETVNSGIRHDLDSPRPKQDKPNEEKT